MTGESEHLPQNGLGSGPVWVSRVFTICKGPNQETGVQGPGGSLGCPPGTDSDRSFPQVDLKLNLAASGHTGSGHVEVVAQGQHVSVLR